MVDGEAVRKKTGLFFALASFWGLPAPRAAKVCATTGAEGTAKEFCGYKRKTPRGRGCETNPILHKPVWKSYQNEAKNEPNWVA
jgi:hypothetical protein